MSYETYFRNSLESESYAKSNNTIFKKSKNSGAVKANELDMLKSSQRFSLVTSFSCFVVVVRYYDVENQQLVLSSCVLQCVCHLLKRFCFASTSSKQLIHIYQSVCIDDLFMFLA